VAIEENFIMLFCDVFVSYEFRGVILTVRKENFEEIIGKRIEITINVFDDTICINKIKSLKGH
jgi:hypothetical protein